MSRRRRGPLGSWVQITPWTWELVHVRRRIMAPRHHGCPLADFAARGHPFTRSLYRTPGREREVISTLPQTTAVRILLPSLRSVRCAGRDWPAGRSSSFPGRGAVRLGNCLRGRLRCRGGRSTTWSSSGCRTASCSGMPSRCCRGEWAWQPSFLSVDGVNPCVVCSDWRACAWGFDPSMRILLFASHGLEHAALPCRLFRERGSALLSLRETILLEVTSISVCAFLKSEFIFYGPTARAGKKRRSSCLSPAD